MVEQRNDPFGQPNSNAGALLELQMLEMEVGSVPDLGALKTLFYRLEAVSQQAPGDAEVQNAVARVKQRVLARGLELKQAAGAPPVGSPMPPATPYPATPPPPMAHTQPWGPPPPYTPQPGGGPAPAPEMLPTAARPVPPVMGEPGVPYGPPPLAQQAPPPPPPPSGGAAWKRALLIGGIIGLIAFGGLVFTLRKTVQRPAPPVVAVEVRTTPAGAQIRINNEFKCKSDCKVELAPGTYQVMAVLDGFENATSTLNVTGGAPPAVHLTLQPSGLQVKLYADLETGQVMLDGQPASELQQGQAILERIQPGKHTVKVAGRGGEATFSLEAAAGQAPVVSGPIMVKNFLAVLVGGAGNSARLHSSVAKLKTALDGQPVGETSVEGLPLSNLSVGDHELTLGEGKDQRKLVLGFTPAPTLTAFLKLDLNAGTLVVSTGEDGATVFLNGKAYPGAKTRRGQLRLPALPVREYSVKVAKEGFQETPEQKVQIRKGEEARLEFKMAPVPKLAGLRLRGAVAGAQVMVDGAAIGLVYSDGTFQNGNIQPGEHSIELRRERYTPKQLRRPFRAGETLELTGADFAMELLPGTLRLNVTPSHARVTIKRSDEAQARPVKETTLRLPEGTYTITASAPNYQDNIVTVQLLAGETKTIPLALAGGKAPAAAPAPVASAAGMEGWDDPGAWVQNGPWKARRGGNFVTYKTQPVQGVFEFKVGRLRGRNVKWFVNYRDARNYCWFQLDRKTFYRRDVVNGKSTDLAKVEAHADSDNEFVIQIVITPTSVTHRIQRHGTWEVLDAWNEASRNFTAGKFGFRIDGSDQIGLASFSFQPK